MKARTIALTISLLCANPIVHAQGTDNRVYAPNELILGMTYGDWSAAWWQFYLQIPNVSNNHPFLSTANDGTCHNGNQPAGPVFYLAGVVSQNQVTRTCNVPTGTPILFPVFNSEFSNLEIKDASGADLRAAVFPSLTPVTNMSVSLDGVSINFLDQFRFESPVFSFTAPSPITNFIFYSKIGSTGGTGTPISVSDGFWIAIKPLPAGRHTLSFSASGPGGTTISNRYYLNVQ